MTKRELINRLNELTKELNELLNEPIVDDNEVYLLWSALADLQVVREGLEA